MSSFRPAAAAGGRTLVVAEAAQGFEGDVTLAFLLVRAAQSAGADVVKFQLVYADEIVTPDHRHFELFSALEMPDESWHTIADECRRTGIGLAVDVFGPRSLRLALSLDPAALKLHASDFFNHELVSAAVAANRPVLISIGGIALEEIDRFLASHAAHASQFTLMYGFQAEPTATADNHLARLATLRTRFPQVALGFMDHADGRSDETTWLAVLALPLGATVIEKHLTLDGVGLEDFVSAAGPAAFRKCVERLRAAELALGVGAVGLTDAEQRYRLKAVKAVVATRHLEAGHTLSDGDVTLLRPASMERGNALIELATALGRRLRIAVAQDQPICLDDLT
jgi:N,N'-diacetyllegionaminate synthase